MMTHAKKNSPMLLLLAPLALATACASRAPAPVATTGARAAAEADRDYGYDFEMDVPKSANASASTALTLPHAEGDRIPPETVQALVRGRFAGVEACYQAGLARSATLAGDVTIRIVANADGAVQSATDDGSTLSDHQVVSCIAGELGKVVFPHGGGVLTVRYPIHLAP